MPTIQEQIREFYSLAGQNQAAAEKQTASVIDAVLHQETILAAWFPGTSHYFISNEYGQQCAVIFSEQQIFERFALECRERGIHVAAVQNPIGERQELFRDFRRCGFTRVIIDYMPLYLNLRLSDFYELPDESGLPVTERTSVSPRMTGKILYLMQEIHTGRAHGGMELDMLKELYRTEFLIPVMRQPDGRVQLPFQTMPDGRRLAMLFTDRTEWANAIRNTELTPSAVRFQDMKRLLADGCDAIVINPQSGAELVLDAQLLVAAEKAAAGDTSGLKLHSLREQEFVNVTEPEQTPPQFTERITACLQNHPEVRQAWLRMIHKDGTILPGYLLILDCTWEDDLDPLYRGIAEAAIPVCEGRSVECISYHEEIAKEWAGKGKPFYRKRRFGFLR